MLWVVELVLILVVIYYFVKWERPLKRFLIYGFLFSIISFILRIPFKLLLSWLENNLEVSGVVVSSGVLILFLSILVVELTRYFSLKRYLTTRSYKNGVLFGMGWAIFDLVVFLQHLVLVYVSSYTDALEIDLLGYMDVIAPVLNFEFFTFVVLMIVALAQTTFVVMSVLKKNKFYLFLSVVYGFLIVCPLQDYLFYFGLERFYEYVYVVLVVIGLFVIFNYRRFK